MLLKKKKKSITKVKTIKAFLISNNRMQLKFYFKQILKYYMFSALFLSYIYLSNISVAQHIPLNLILKDILVYLIGYDILNKHFLP